MTRMSTSCCPSETVKTPEDVNACTQNEYDPIVTIDTVPPDKTGTVGCGVGTCSSTVEWLKILLAQEEFLAGTAKITRALARRACAFVLAEGIKGLSKIIYQKVLTLKFDVTCKFDAT